MHFGIETGSVEVDFGKVQLRRLSVMDGFRTQAMQGPVERVVDYSDWRDASGLSLPYKRLVTENGEPSSEDTVKSIELNPAVDPKLFTP